MSKFLGGGVLVPRCRRLDAWRHGVACPLMGREATARPFVLFAHARHPEPDVEALTSGIVSAFIIGVGVAEAIVARGMKRRMASGSQSPERSTLVHASSSSEELVWV